MDGKKKNKTTMKKRITTDIIKFFGILLMFLFVISCTNKKIFEQYHKFDNLSWNRFNYLKFEVPIENTAAGYDIFLTVRHLSDYPYPNLDINFTILIPSGEMRTADYSFEIKDKEGKMLSECPGDYCDIKFPLRKGFIFSEPGIVKFEIENKMTKLETPGIIEVGLIIEKSKR